MTGYGCARDLKLKPYTKILAAHDFGSELGFAAAFAPEMAVIGLRLMGKSSWHTLRVAKAQMK